MSDMTIGQYDAAATIDGSTHYLLIQPGNSSTAYKKINRNVLLGLSGAPVGTIDSQALTNKTIGNTNTVTLKDTLFTLQDDSDTTKQARFELSGITTATTRTYTLPNASSTLADIATAQTMTNKTLTAPVINNGSITGTTITTDAIIGQSASTSGTIYGLSVSSGKVGSNGVIAGSITNASVTANKLATGAAAAFVATSETTTSTSYVDLATTSDSVTVTIGVNGLALVSFQAFMQNNTTTTFTYVGITVSGANIEAATDTKSLQYLPFTNNATGQYGNSILYTGLTPGSTTFKLKYKVAGGTGTFQNRRIGVVPL